MNIDIQTSKVTSNDIAVIRNLILANAGWSTIPYYAMAEEVQYKTCSIVKGGEIKGYKYGVWWMRGRDSLSPWIDLAQEWLVQQDLEV